MDDGLRAAHKALGESQGPSYAQKSESWAVHERKGRKIMKRSKIYTAFYRDGRKGNVKRRVFECEKFGYSSIKEVEEDIRGNGFRVIKVYLGNISIDKFDRWYSVHRK